VYDFEQWGGVTYHDRTQDAWGNRLMENVNDTFIKHANIVDAIKTAGNDIIYADGKHRLYINMLSCHDNSLTCAKGNRVYMGYQALFAPFIPMWFIGEEWNNPQNMGGTGCLYYNKINWAALDKPDNRAYYEDVKRMIRVRRQYADIFTHFPDSVRDANICKVTTSRDDDLQAYARWYGERAVLIVPNTDDVRESRKFTVTVPWEDMGLRGSSYVVTDAYTGKVLAKGRPDSITLTIDSCDVAAIAIAPADAATEAATTTATATATTAAATTTAATTAAGSQPAATVTATTTAAATVPTSATTAAADTATPADTAAVPWVAVGVAGGAAVLIAAALLLLRRRK
jgi:hypothetical protein